MVERLRTERARGRRDSRDREDHAGRHARDTPSRRRELGTTVLLELVHRGGRDSAVRRRGRTQRVRRLQVLRVGLWYSFAVRNRLGIRRTDGDTQYGFTWAGSLAALQLTETDFSCFSPPTTQQFNWFPLRGFISQLEP